MNAACSLRSPKNRNTLGDGVSAHVYPAYPTCPALGADIADAAAGIGQHLHHEKTYACVEGPRLGTRAESFFLRDSAQCDLVGMTNVPEVFLAREAQLAYCTLCLVTDYDCWHPDHDHVTVDAIIKVLMDNAEKARALVKYVVPRLADRKDLCHQGCHEALDNALITAPDARDPVMAEKLSAVAGRVLG